MKITHSSFTKYTLNPQEEQSGMILNDSQLAVLHNLRTDIADQKINLDFTPNDVLGFTQQEAFLSGQLKLLQHLIDRSEEAVKNALEIARNTSTQTNS